MAPTAESETRAYPTRLRGRLRSIEKKYDDIFSSVVKKALTENICTKTLYHNLRSTSECESVDSSDISTSDTNGSRSPSVTRISESDDVIILDDEEHDIIKKLQCECKMLFSTHEDLHRHIAFDHSPSPLSRCRKCGINAKAVRHQHICRICHEFTTSMEEHLRKHYQDRSGRDALMECRRCYRSFSTVEEVREHERRVHSNRTKSTHWICNYCQMAFTSRHTRDNHLVDHVDKAVGGVWEKIEQMQEVMTDQFLVNQCPVCLSVMGSRKSFRLHIIHKHLLKDPDSFIASLGLPTVAEVLKAGEYSFNVKEEDAQEYSDAAGASKTLKEAKREVKEEPND